ncbi:MAG TPA: hypothetical protein DCE56_13025 [Cyanobacteria bacterium UBA8553]|nr:hypothetical protein [Cyanobacteria bacterium UBA8553]
MRIEAAQKQYPWELISQPKIATDFKSKADKADKEEESKVFSLLSCLQESLLFLRVLSSELTGYFCKPALACC